MVIAIIGIWPACCYPPSPEPRPNASSVWRTCAKSALALLCLQDNDDRLPWQLTPSGQIEHFGKNFALDPDPIYQPRRETEIVTPKFFGRPVMPNAKLPQNAVQVEHKTREGRPMRNDAISYVFCEGGDIGRPENPAATRNLST